MLLIELVARQRGDVMHICQHYLVEHFGTFHSLLKTTIVFHNLLKPSRDFSKLP
jgi:hypothetical protein